MSPDRSRGSWGVGERSACEGTVHNRQRLGIDTGVDLGGTWGRARERDSMRMQRSMPGLAFSVVCDIGFVVGLVTHQIPKIGDLVWLSEKTFDEFPSLAEVEGISDWRWPVFFPVGSAMHRKEVDPIGIVEIPPDMRAMPPMRSRNPLSGGWVRAPFQDGKSVPGGPTHDRSLPVYGVINTVALKERLVSGWRPKDRW